MKPRDEALTASLERIKERALLAERSQTKPIDTSDEEWPERLDERSFHLYLEEQEINHQSAPTKVMAAQFALPCTRCTKHFIFETRDSYEHVVPCRCHAGHHGAKQLRRAMLPPRAMKHHLSSVEWELIENAEEVYEALERVINGERYKGRRGLLLHGNIGAGKTRIMQGLLIQLILGSGLRGRYLHWPRWLKRLETSLREDTSRSGQKLMEEILGWEVLALDDLGMEHPSSWSMQELGRLMSDFEEQELLLLSTSSLDLEQMSARLGAEKMERLLELLSFVEVKAPDYRCRS